MRMFPQPSLARPHWIPCAAHDFGDPVDLVVGVLLHEAVRRALSEVEKASRGPGETWQAGAAVAAQVRHWLDELEDQGTVRAAADRLVAWLMEREPKEG